MALNTFLNNGGVPGRFGNARDGAPTPRGRRRGGTTLPSTGLGFEVEDVDSAEKALVDVDYDSFNRVLIFKRAPVSGGGGSALYFGTVMGGNSTTVRTPQADPVGTSVIALPTPFYNEDGDLAPYALPVVEDWADYPQVMPSYVAYGSPLPVLPDGLCYIRLERPYSVVGSSWDSGYPPNIVNQVTAPPLAITARVSGTTLNKVVVHFDTELSRIGSSGLFHLFDVTEDRVVSLSSAVRDVNTVTLNLSRELDKTHSYALAIDARAVFADFTGTPEHRGRANDAQELAVVFEFLSNSLVIALNRVGSQTFYAGDLVSMQDSGIAITDTDPESGVSTSRAVVELLSNASNARSPHTHIISEFGNDGGLGAIR